MNRRLLAYLVPLLGALLAPGCGSYSTTPSTPTSAPSGAPASVVVTISGNAGSMSFSPDLATLRPGQTVAWHNADGVTHHIVQNGVAGSGGDYNGGSASGAGFDSGAISPGGTSGAISFSSTGTIAYHCSIHPSMVGRLTIGQ